MQWGRMNESSKESKQWCSDRRPSMNHESLQDLGRRTGWAQLTNPVVSQSMPFVNEERIANDTQNSTKENNYDGRNIPRQTVLGRHGGKDATRTETKKLVETG